MASRPGASRRGLTLLAPALLVGLTALAFGPATSGDFVWDDALLIANNSHLRSADHLDELLTGSLWSTGGETESASQYYRPVVSAAYFVQFQLFGLAPRGYHLVNLALHATCALLVLAWLRRRLARRALAPESDLSSAERATLVAALLGALLFALHPTRTESVTWISGSTDLWMTLCMLLTAHLGERPSTALRAIATALLGALALLSKETAIVLPALMWLDGRLLERSEPERRLAARGAWLAAGGMLIALIVRLQLVSLPKTDLRLLLHGLTSRVLSTLGHYAQAVLWPLSPTSLRGEVWMTADGNYGVEPMTVAGGACAILLVFALVMRGAQRGTHKPWLADLAWVALPLAPVINILPTQLMSLASDRFLYAPAIGLAALFARWIANGWPDWSRRRRALLLGGTSSVLAVFVLVIVVYGKAFANEGALWDYELQREPVHIYALERSADIALGRGDTRRAIELATRGEQLARETLRPVLQHQFMLVALAAQRTGTPDLEQARLRTLRDFYDGLATAKPGQITALDLPPLVVERAGEDAREILPGMQLRVAFTQAERRAFEVHAIRLELGRASLHARTYQLDRAIELVEQLVQERPHLVEAWSELAIFRGRKRDFAGAERAAQKGLASGPAHRAVFDALRSLKAAGDVFARKNGVPAHDALIETQTDLMLGAHSAARARVDGLLSEHPEDLALIAMRARVDALDRRPDLALRRVLDAQRAVPGAAGAFAALERELRAMQR